MRNRNAQQLASELGVGVPLLALRYGLQRGFVEIFGSKTPDHMRSNLNVFAFELNASTLANIACWNPGSLCNHLNGAVGLQANDRTKRRHFVPVNAYTAEEFRYHPRAFQASGWDAGVQLTAEEEDPITFGLHGSAASVAELRSAPALSVAGPQHMEPLGSIKQLQALHGSCTSAARICSFRLEVAAPGTSSFMDERYMSIVRSLSERIGHALDDRGLTNRQSERKDGLGGAQHVIALQRGSVSPFTDDLDHIREQYIEPHLRRLAYAETTRFSHRMVVSRNAHDFDEKIRKRALLWHADSSADTDIKVILYLDIVDNQNGCMVALRHNTTRETFKVDSNQIRGSFGTSVFTSIPAVWMAELTAEGYEPDCLAAPQGSLVIFDTNIVHRGSRPRRGRHRDIVLWTFTPILNRSGARFVVSQSKPSGHHDRGRRLELQSDGTPDQRMRMLQGLAGSDINVKALANAWFKDAFDDTAREYHDTWAEWGSIARVRHPVESLWMRLTAILASQGRLPFNARKGPVQFMSACVGRSSKCLPYPPQEPHRGATSTPFRADKHAWLKVHMTPSKLPQLKRRGKQCAETGDGHYLNRYHSDCVVKLSLDKFDPKAQLALDLNELPQRAGKAAQYYGTLDLVVCHDVFEHLEKPENAMSNLNALLKVGGTLVWTAPLIVFEHGSPHDWHRYTTRSVHRLFRCAGLEVQILHGIGSTLSMFAYLVGATSADVPEGMRGAVLCDASFSETACDHLRFMQVAAVGIKNRSITGEREEITECQ